MALSLHCGVLCKKESESVKHLFMHCSFSTDIWNYFLGGVSLSRAMLEELMDEWVIMEAFFGMLYFMESLGEYGEKETLEVLKANAKVVLKW